MVVCCSWLHLLGWPSFAPTIFGHIWRGHVVYALLGYWVDLSAHFLIGKIGGPQNCFKFWGIIVFVNLDWCQICQHNCQTFIGFQTTPWADSYTHTSIWNNLLCRFILSLLAFWVSPTYILCVLDTFFLTERSSLGNFKTFTIFNQGGDDYIQGLVFTWGSSLSFDVQTFLNIFFYGLCMKKK